MGRHSHQLRPWIARPLGGPLALLLATWATLALASPATAADNAMITLWPEGAPGASGTTEADKPTLEVYLPQGKATDTGVVICPGGGYQHLALDHEGKQIAEWFNSQGATAFVLRYRLAPRYKHPAPMQDVQRALRTVRARAAEWKLNPRRIGVIGFSAGGHLASTAATHFDLGDVNSADTIEQQSCRPDFAILVYPVISLTTDYVHAGSRKNLLGDDPEHKLMEHLSNELQVTRLTPPCFLVHSGEDTAVPPENSVLFFIALRVAQVPAEMHIFEHGPHGFGLGQKDKALSTWPGLCADWLRRHRMLTDAPTGK